MTTTRKDCIIDIKNKKCPCGKQPSFGFKDDKKATCCSKCKQDNMIDIKNKKCPCGTRPSFGFENDKKATCCNKCKQDNMIDIKRKKCPCGKQPVFGFEDDKKATCCSKCKQDGMTNIKDKKCPCGTHPVFGFEDDKKATCCNNCKKDGMTNIKDKKCPCGTRPSFGFEDDKKATCCNKCKKGGMTNIKSKKCPCGKHPLFGFENDKKPTCCKNCKQDNMIDIHNKKCKTHLCDIRVTNKRYRGYCSRCFFYTFPDEPVTRNYKIKENTIVKFLDKNFEEKYDSVSDRRVKDGCSLRRPDKLYDFGSHVVIIEIDENKHSGYSCENKRTMEIFQDIGNRPCVFIRFNPDSYTSNGKKIKSPFTVKRDTGKLELTNKKEFDGRLSVLKDTLEKYAHNYKPIKDLDIIQLFY